MFITDIQKDEVPLLNENSKGVLVFQCDDGRILATVNTVEAWTHERLMKIDLEGLLGIGYHNLHVEAFIDNEWVGSTEI